MSSLAAISSELGLNVLVTAHRDVHLLIAQRVVRLFAYGQSTLVLASFLHLLQVSDFGIGLFMTLTLVGDVVGSLILTLYADRWGRKRTLLVGSALMATSGVVFSISQSYTLLLLAAIVGVISPSGNEVGPFKAIEESTMSSLVLREQRSTIFAWYAVLSGAAGAFGSLTAGWIAQLLESSLGWSRLSAYRLVFALYAIAALVKGALTYAMTDECEVVFDKPKPNDKDVELLLPNNEGDQQNVSRRPLPQSRLAKVIGIQNDTLAKLRTLGLLFALDNLGAGLVPLQVPKSFVIYFFQTKFDLAASTIGETFFVTSLVAALSNLVAASLSRRIGNVKTMAFTHLPSSIFLVCIPIPDSFFPALVLLILRFCTAQMDGAPRSAFLASYVPDNERTAVMGVINIIKTISQSVGPSATGYLANKGKIRYSFFLAGGMKASYDLLVLYFLSNVAMVS